MRVKKTATNGKRRIVPSGVLPGLTTPVVAGQSMLAPFKLPAPEVPQAPLVVAAPDAKVPGNGKRSKKQRPTVDPVELKQLFKKIWQQHDRVDQLAKDSKAAVVEQQRLLSQAYALVGGTVMQTDDGRTFRIRPVGPERVFVFIWESNPANVIRV